MDAQGRRIDQLKEMELKLHPDLKEPLRKLCNDPKTTVVVLSGSDRNVLDEVSYLHKLTSFYQHLYLLTDFIYRILENIGCGWLLNMECFCDKQRGIG